MEDWVFEDDSMAKFVRDEKRNTMVIQWTSDKELWFYSPPGILRTIKNPTRNHEFWFDEYQQYHRMDGPAKIWTDRIEFWIDGKQYKFDTWLEQLEASLGEEHAALMKLKWAKNG